MQGGYSPARGLQNTNTQWVVAPVENKITKVVIQLNTIMHSTKYACLVTDAVTAPTSHNLKK